MDFFATREYFVKKIEESEGFAREVYEEALSSYANSNFSLN